jgi:hypothetical protein
VCLVGFSSSRLIRRLTEQIGVSKHRRPRRAKPWWRRLCAFDLRQPRAQNDSSSDGGREAMRWAFIAESGSTFRCSRVVPGDDLQGREAGGVGPSRMARQNK